MKLLLLKSTVLLRVRRNKKETVWRKDLR